uniref:RING-type E3 ubiquitin transferase n=4 Tax=Aegilops tauschii subsp. strangulata TaxID=200361 RepID=A0A453E860_AEGTS
ARHERGCGGRRGSGAALAPLSATTPRPFVPRRPSASSLPATHSPFPCAVALLLHWVRVPWRSGIHGLRLGVVAVSLGVETVPRNFTRGSGSPMRVSWPRWIRCSTPPSRASRSRRRGRCASQSEAELATSSKLPSGIIKPRDAGGISPFLRSTSFLIGLVNKEGGGVGDGGMEKLSSAAAFVEGGVYACDHTCSICLKAFCDSDSSTVTGCKHDLHLQCILEWCQRSSQCPMCWQAINTKDPMR